MIEAILPSGVVAEEAFDDPPDAKLFPEEEALLVRAVDKRRREFTTARWCARRALARLGASPVPILPGRRGQPQWPPGFVGSMTHCAGYRAAALAPAGRAQALGIDGEPDEPVPDGVLDVISLPEERDHLASLAGTDPAVSVDRLLFSAKESVFKAWYPLTAEELGFRDATLRFDPTRRSFHARLLSARARGTELEGRWLAVNGLVVTAVVLA